ncbi:MAG: ATP-binding cassette domain-containing protein [Phycisphaerae bacterium]
MNQESAVDIRGVKKVYKRKVHALDGVDLRVGRGEVFGLLGPNGAGKSTLVKILMTIVRPTHASGTLLGRKIGHKPTLARVGYLPENHRFPPYLTGRQAMHYYGALAKVPFGEARKRTEELLGRVKMAGAADRKVSTYSKGMQQRVGLAQALINDPDLVILDEPTDGLDPVGRHAVKDLLDELRGRGKTIFINSHLLGEVEQVCDNVAILVDGKIITRGQLDELRGTSLYYEVDLLPDGHEASPSEELARALDCRWKQAGKSMGPIDLQKATAGEVQAATLAGGLRAELEGSTLRLDTEDVKQIQPLLDRVRDHGLLINRVQPRKPTLEELFMKAVGPGERSTTSAPAAAQQGETV